MKIFVFLSGCFRFLIRFFALLFNSILFFSVVWIPLGWATKNLANSCRQVLQTTIATKNEQEQLAMLFSNLDKQAKAVQTQLEQVQLPPNSAAYAKARAHLMAPKVTFFFHALRMLFERRLDKLSLDYETFSLESIAHEEVKLTENEKLTYGDLWVMFEIALDPKLVVINGEPRTLFAFLGGYFLCEYVRLQQKQREETNNYLNIMTIPKRLSISFSTEWMQFKSQCKNQIELWKDFNSVDVSELKKACDLCNVSIISKSRWPHVLSSMCYEKQNYLESLSKAHAISYYEHMLTLVEMYELEYAREQEHKFYALTNQALLKQKKSDSSCVSHQSPKPKKNKKRQKRPQKVLKNQSADISIPSFSMETPLLSKKIDSIDELHEEVSLTWEQEKDIIEECIQHQKEILEIFEKKSELPQDTKGVQAPKECENRAQTPRFRKVSENLLWALKNGSAVSILKYSPQKVAVLLDDLQIEHVLRVHSGDIKLVASYKDPALGKYVLHMLGKHCKSSPQKLKKDLVDFLDYWEPKWRDLT